MNESLVDLPFVTRLLFIGLWTLADREGRLEDRPRRIKMALFPSDDVNVEKCLAELAGKGLIDRYEAQGLRVILVRNFKKHQNPHHAEKASELPDPYGHYAAQSLTVSCASKTQKRKVKAQGKDEANPADSLIPDSLNEDSFHKNKGKKEVDGEANEVEEKAEEKPEEEAQTGLVQKELVQEEKELSKRRQQLPKNFRLSADDCAFAKERGIDHQQELETFRSYHQAKGALMLDWHAAWRTWCMNAVKFAQRAQSAGAKVSKAKKVSLSEKNYAKGARADGTVTF